MFEHTNDSKNSGMDEILSSIRQTIHEDLQQVTTPVQTSNPNELQQQTLPENHQDSDQDVLELTQSVQEDGSVIDLTALSTQPANAEPVNPIPHSDVQNSLIPNTDVDLAAVQAPGDLPQSPISPVQSDFNTPLSKDTMTQNQLPSMNESILSQETIQESMDALSALNALSQPNPIQGPQTPAQHSLEDVVKDALKPMLKQWLDANLPDLVKQVVREQIEKVLKKTGA